LPKRAYVDLEPEGSHDDPSGIGEAALAAREFEHINHKVACKRTKLKVLMANPALRPPLQRFVEGALEHNQQVRSCCRNTETHEIEAFFSSPTDEAKGIPDIYIIYCQCGRKHRTFCVGGSHRPRMVTDGLGNPRAVEETPEEYEAKIASSKRPFWDVR
jgi:hypothetical protein